MTVVLRDQLLASLAITPPLAARNRAKLKAEVLELSAQAVELSAWYVREGRSSADEALIILSWLFREQAQQEAEHVSR